MIESIERKYARLLMDYSLYIKKGERLYIKTTIEAEPLVREVYRTALERGAIVEYHMSFSGQNKMLMDLSDEAQINHVSTSYENALRNFDAYLLILAPANLKEEQGINTEKLKLRKKAIRDLLKVYNERTGSGSLKRSLCLYPTLASAQFAGMAMDDYKQFVYKACKLDQPDPVKAWLQVRENQQHIADRLNEAKMVHYKGSNIDVSFSVEGRTWINSDGRNNMPSGEVFTGPVEDSVNGKVTFSYPSIYMGEEVENVTLWIKDGYVKKWDASKGKDFLNRVFRMKGTRRFGEVAIGTNYDIDRITKNILFDEKIGGTIHMAIGQSYKNTGGKNESVVHWDMITDMKKDGQIFADSELIYEKGKFLL
jgi:aminopeptidase